MRVRVPLPALGVSRAGPLARDVVCKSTGPGSIPGWLSTPSQVRRVAAGRGSAWPERLSGGQEIAGSNPAVPTDLVRGGSAPPSHPRGIAQGMPSSSAIITFPSANGKATGVSIRGCGFESRWEHRAAVPPTLAPRSAPSRAPEPTNAARLLSPPCPGGSGAVLRTRSSRFDSSQGDQALDSSPSWRNLQAQASEA